MPDALPLHGPDTPRAVAAAAAATTSSRSSADASMTSRILGQEGPRPRHDKQSLPYIMRSGIAGGLAGCAAKSLIAPLDRVKILFQSSNPQFRKYTGSWAGVAKAMGAIQRQDGLLGLFRGHSATLLRIFPYAAVKFIAYEQVRSVLIRSKEQETTLRRLACGSLAGVTSVLCTYPLEVIRVRLAFETRQDYRSSLRDICTRIYYEPHAYNYRLPIASGLGNFYRGFSPTLLGMLPYAGVSFLTHDLAGDWMRSPKLARYTLQEQELELDPKRPHDRKPVLRVWAELFTGGLAGMVSQTASYPLEVIRRRMQVGGAIGESRFPGIAETAGKIWREAGVRGFFVGLTIGYAKIVPMVATGFFVYERMKLWMDIA